MSRAQLRAGLIGSRDGQTLPCMGVQVDATVAAGVSVTPGTSNTPGAWTELIAATAGEGHHVTVTLLATHTSGVAVPMLMDLAIGAAASEVAIVSSIAAGQHNGTTFVLPVFVPAGSRLSCRLTSSNASVPTATVRCEVDDRADRSARRSPPKLVAIGANAGASSGVTINTNDTWTEITSATTEPYQALVMTIGGNDNSFSATTCTVSLGVGTSGAERTIDAVTLESNSQEYYRSLVGGFFPVGGTFPKGTRIAMKHSVGASNTSHAIVLGVPYT